jgi:ankyrin repeat protein
MKYIKLLEEHSFSQYDLITLSTYDAFEMIIQEVYSKNPDIELVRNIIEYSPIGVNAVDKNGRTLLMEIATNNNIEILELFLGHREIDPNLKEKDYGRTALMEVMFGREERTEQARLIIEHPKTDINIEDNSGLTALWWGAYWNHANIVKLLLDRPDIDINKRYRNGNTVLMDIAHTKRVEIIEIFLQYPRVDKTLQNDDGKTAWDLAEDYVRNSVPQLNPDFQ